MQEYIIRLPNSLLISPWELNMTVAARLYEMGKLSAGQAAEVVGISKRAFIELLGKFGVSVFGYEAEDLREELESL